MKANWQQWFVEWAGRDWPITDIAEWGERVVMPDEEPAVMPGGKASR